MKDISNLSIVIGAPTVDYPYGYFIDSDPIGSGNGTPAIAAWVNDPTQALYAALNHFGLTPSDTPENINDSDMIRLIQKILPVGAIIPVAFNTNPATLNIRALACEGGVIAQATYPDLYAAIGATWNTGGEGAGNFRLPDFRGYFLRGWDNGAGIDAGRGFATLQADANLSHVHPVAGSAPFAEISAVLTYGATNILPEHPISVAPAVVATAIGGTEARPKNKAIRYLIRY